MTHDSPDIDPRVMDALARAVPQLAPPPALRARVLALATTTPSAARRTMTTGRTLAPWLAAAAAAALAVVASLGWWSSRNEVTRLQAMLADVQRGLTALVNVRADLDSAQAERDRAAAILAAPDVQRVLLNGVSPADSARAQVYVSATRGIFFAAEGLPSLPADRVYQLWAIVGSTPVSAGTFALEPSGRGRLVTTTRAAAAVALAVTVEPAGGVPAPTGPKYLLGTAN